MISSLSKVTGYLIWANIAAIISGLGFLITLTWKISKFHSQVLLMNKDLNGFGSRVGKMERENHSLDKRVTVLEHKVDG